MDASVVAAMEGFARPGLAPLDLALRAGEVVLLSGPNGSGKSSLLRLLAGLASPLPAHAVRPAPSVQLLAQEPRDSLVGLTVAGEFRLRRLPAPPLGRLADQETATLSSGEARRVGLDVVRQARPRLLLLDEPAEGLDAAGVERLGSLVRAAAAAGAAVVAADHTGALDAVATRRVALAPEQETPLALIPADAADPRGPAVVTAPPARVLHLLLPAVSLGPGLHALAGPNGSGKSTLLLRLAGLQAARGVQVAGAPPRPGRTVRLLLPRARHLLTRPAVADELRGLPPSPLVPAALLPRHPLTLSGGEAQRVALAKTLGRPAPLYLLDEPDAHLDAAAWPLLRDAIAARVAEGACVVAATHDRRLAALAHSTVQLEAP